MYNEMRKLQYLTETGKDTDDSNLANMFKLAESREIEYGRDLCEWTSGEILDLYRYYSTPYVQTLVKVNNDLRNYTVWCIMNSLVADGQNHYDEITTQAMCGVIDFERLKALVVTRSQLLIDIKKLYNAGDKYIFLALFEGVPTRDSMIAKVRVEDLDGNLLTLTNRDEIDISDELVNIINEACAETEYIAYGIGGKTYQYEYSDTAFKTIARERKHIDNIKIQLGTRMRKAAAFLGYENMTAKTLTESGRIDFIQRYISEHNVTLDQMLHEYRDIHERRFGKLQNTVTYSLTYGRMIV